MEFKLIFILKWDFSVRTINAVNVIYHTADAMSPASIRKMYKVSMHCTPHY